MPSQSSLSSWPLFDPDQINAVSRVLSSGQVNSWTGSETKKFEDEFASWCGSKYAIAISNGSLALSASYLSVGLGQGDELITTPRTFIATASSAVLLGAKPVFADVDPDSGSITADTIAPLINSRTKAISVVHLGGWPADMPAILILPVPMEFLSLRIAPRLMAHALMVKLLVVLVMWRHGAFVRTRS